MNISANPWRYERCVVFEQDLDILRDDLPGTKAKLPGRVVLNAYTLTLFETSNYQKVICSMNLKNLQLSSDGDANCFTVKGKKSKAWTLCNLSTYQGDAIKQISDWKENI